MVKSFVRRRVYDDLGRYLGRVEALSLLNRFDLLLWNEVIAPKAPNFEYYIAHEPGMLLRADSERGVYMLIERLRGLGAAYQSINPLSEGKYDVSLPQTFLVMFYPDIWNCSTSGALTLLYS